MQKIYDSPNYCVVEFSALEGNPSLAAGGYEIVDKNTKREIFLDGQMAQHFRMDVQKLIAAETPLEEVDDFLGQFDSLMMHPVVLH